MQSGGALKGAEYVWVGASLSSAPKTVFLNLGVLYRSVHNHRLESVASAGGMCWERPEDGIWQTCGLRVVPSESAERLTEAVLITRSATPLSRLLSL